MKNYLNLSTILLVSIILSVCGCGGGGASGASGSGGSNPNPPQVDAGVDFSAQEGRIASLQGKVLNTVGSIATIQWTQLSGPPVTLQLPNTLFPSFKVPSYAPDIAPVTFQLSVTDSNGLSNSDTVVVSITPEWWQMRVENEYAYIDIMSMVDNQDFIELELNPNETYDIVLRTFLGYGGLRVYSSNSLSSSQLIAQSVSPGSTKNAIKLAPTGLNKVYLEVVGGYGNQYTLTVRARSPFLEPGFPVDTTLTSGTWQSGAEHRALTIGNIDSDPELEILLSGVALGPLYAFNHDGSVVNGWPVAATTNGAAYPSIGELNGNSSQREVATGFGPFLGSCTEDRFLFTGEGTIMPGWPKTSCNAGTTTPPMLADIDNDGVDEILFEGGVGFYSDGRAIPAWPGSTQGGQPSFGDVTGDGQPELVFSRYITGDVVAYSPDGTLVPGFPATVNLGSLSTIRSGPVGLANLDGVGGKEIVRLLKVQDNPSYFIVQAFSGNGTLLWQRQTDEGSGWETVLSFGDLNGDGLPEVLMQTDTKIYAWDGTGTLLPNFPINYAADTNLGTAYTGNAGSSAPLIADVTGDNLPDIIVAGANYLAIYSASGVLEKKIRTLDNHVMFAVADIDLDGRNEIVVAEADGLWHGHNYEDVATIWVYDLGGTTHGAVQWGQLGGNSRHQYSFPPIQ
jgi:hypothetical protein